MSRGIADPVQPEEPQDAATTEDVENAIRDLIISHNRLHDRLVHLEREMDHLTSGKEPKPKKWTKGL